MLRAELQPHAEGRWASQGAHHVRYAGANLWPEALLGVEAASGEGEGCEGASAAVTSTETPSAEGARSREAAERRAALRRQAFFCAGRRQVGHCMHRACRLLPPEPGRPRPPWSPHACQQTCLLVLHLAVAFATVQ